MAGTCTSSTAPTTPRSAKDDDRYLAARAIQLFARGIPQIYYVGLLAGTNDHGCRWSATGEGRAINRHDYPADEVGRGLGATGRRSVSLALVRLRNTHPAFDGELAVVTSGQTLQHDLGARGKPLRARSGLARGCLASSELLAQTAAGSSWPPDLTPAGSWGGLWARTHNLRSHHPKAFERGSAGSGTRSGTRFESKALTAATCDRVQVTEATLTIFLPSSMNLRRSPEFSAWPTVAPTWANCSIVSRICLSRSRRAAGTPSSTSSRTTAACSPTRLEDLAGLIPADDPDRQLERVGDSPLAPDQTTTSESERSEELAVAPTRLATRRAQASPAAAGARGVEVIEPGHGR